MFTATLFATAALLIIVLTLTYRSSSNYKQGMLFAITLPPHAIEHPQTIQIQQMYKLKSRRNTIIVSLTALPLLLFHNAYALQMFYFFIWTVVLILTTVVPFRRAMQATLALKRKHEWFVGKKQIIYADLRAAQLKNKRSASLLLFMLPLILASIFTWSIYEQERELLLLGIISVALVLLMLLIVIFQLRSKSTVYSTDSNINVALNQAKRRSLSYLYLFLAFVQVGICYSMMSLIQNEIEIMKQVWLIAIIILTCVSVLIIILVYWNINRREEQLLQYHEQTIYSDDDEYWTNGFTYHNPLDKSLLVPKRIGIGETINTGTFAGKLIMGGVVLLLFVTMLGTSIMLLISEYASPQFKITDDQRIEIQYPLYSYETAMTSIKDMYLIDTIPDGLKVNGEATSKHARGNFKLDELGKTKLFIYKNNPPYIVIVTDELHVIYNEEDNDQTQLLFKQLQQLLDTTQPN